MTNDELKEVKLAWARGEAVQNKVNGEWEDWKYPGYFHPGDYEWRIKPKTIRIGSYDVPEPLREMTCGQIYWIANPMHGVFFDGTENNGDYADRKWLSLGLCHASKEAAEIHTKALLSFTEQK